MADLQRDMGLIQPTPAIPATISPAWTLEDHEYRTAAELADLRLTDLPTTKRRVNIMARREAWRQLGPGKARIRRGRGGGWEYHVSCLPPAAQDDYRRRLEAQGAEPQIAGRVGERPPTGLPAAARSAAALSARQRRVMEARSAVLREVDRRVFVDGISRRKAILALVEDAAWDLHCVRQGRNDQCVLTPELLQAACDANDRGRGDRGKGDRGRVLSLRGVYTWFQAYEADGTVALAPAVTRRRQDHPEWLNGFLRFYCTPAKISIGHALEKYAASVPDDHFVPSYDQAKRALKALQGTSRFLDAHRGREPNATPPATCSTISPGLSGRAWFGACGGALPERIPPPTAS